MTDVFGQALKGYLKGGLPQYVIRGANGNYEKIDIETFFTSYSDWNDYEKTLIANYAQGRILDIGAGAGRHSIFLQNKGCDVHAIDVSPQAVSLMKLRGLNNVYLMDLREIDFPKDYFDTILIMFNDLGLAGSVAKTTQLFKKLFKITNPNGRIIITLRNPLKTNGSKYLLYKKDPKNPELIEKMKIRMEYNDAKGDWFNSMMVSPRKLKDLVKDTGWFINNAVKGNDNFYGAVLQKNTFPNDRTEEI